MIKVSVLYPNGNDKVFDMDDNCSNHVAFFTALLGDAKAFGPNAEKIKGDMTNFTNSYPINQVSQVMI